MTEEQEIAIIELIEFVRRFWDNSHDSTNAFEACNIVLKLKDTEIPESIINSFINSLG